ncbi:MAG: hypothetical protein CL915_14955 [Deltaproteobacteria bacterium]|jgi:hypothetical protein|nr:hypothetical protein [Deltaproteobacteria bacterium]
MEEIEEGKLSDAAARLIALAIKKRVINKGREVRSTQDPDKKLDLLSQQISALAALTLVGISVGGDGLLSKGGILSRLFTEDFQKEIESNLTTNPSPTKSDPRNPIYRDSKEPENNLTPFMDAYVESISRFK